MDSVAPEIIDGICRATGKAVVDCAPLPRSGGYSPALRLLARFADGSTAFVKAATNESTADWLRRESTVYQTLGEQPFLSRYHGLAEFGTEGRTLLVLEDLSDAYWGPPWREGDVERVREALQAFHPLASRFPEGFLPPQEAAYEDLAGWHRVAADPEPFLSLGFCTWAWLDAALPTLLEAEQSAPLAGDDLVHQDIRSDNLCFTPDGRAIVVDWNWCCRGNGTVDIAGWLPSLHHEGGPAPDTILPNEPGLAAILAGYWASKAGLPPQAWDITGRVRRVQREQLTTAFPWAIRSLGLPPP